VSTYTILAVEDEEDLLELVTFNLQKSGYGVIGTTSGEEALRLARSATPDLVLLDLMLPGLDGLDVCRILKHDAATRQIPVIMLTARGGEADIVTGLELGADDYITKPFSPKVLVARVGAMLRRQGVAAPGESATIILHNLAIDPGRHKVYADGVAVELTFTEFRILHLLARRPGWVFTRYQIVDAVRGEDYSVTERSVDVHMAAMRKKLGSTGVYLETVRGVGYRLKEG
jgi:two-component system alkaline phosphatase synthesis response regulator PhoP